MHSRGASIGTSVLAQNVRQYFEQVVLQGLAELIAREIMCIACWGITTHDFPSSLN